MRVHCSQREEIGAKRLRQRRKLRHFMLVVLHYKKPEIDKRCGRIQRLLRGDDRPHSIQDAFQISQPPIFLIRMLADSINRDDNGIQARMDKTLGLFSCSEKMSIGACQGFDPVPLGINKFRRLFARAVL